MCWIALVVLIDFMPGDARTLDWVAPVSSSAASSSGGLLLSWLWWDRNGMAAASAERGLQHARPEDLVCQICQNRRFDLDGGVASHLLSFDHLQNLLRFDGVPGVMASGSSLGACAVLDALVQSWVLPGGHCLVLRHLPIEVVRTEACDRIPGWYNLRRAFEAWQLHTERQLIDAPGREGMVCPTTPDIEAVDLACSSELGSSAFVSAFGAPAPSLDAAPERLHGSAPVIEDACRKALASLVGTWYDDGGSLYTVDPFIAGQSLSVTTTRSNGHWFRSLGTIHVGELFTGPCIMFGKSGSFILQMPLAVNATGSVDRVVWRPFRAHSRQYEWYRDIGGVLGDTGANLKSIISEADLKSRH